MLGNPFIIFGNLLNRKKNQGLVWSSFIHTILLYTSWTIHTIAQDNQNSWYSEVYLYISNSDNWAIWRNMLNKTWNVICKTQPVCQKDKWPGFFKEQTARKKNKKYQRIGTCHGGRRMVCEFSGSTICIAKGCTWISFPYSVWELILKVFGSNYRTYWGMALLRLCPDVTRIVT